jgi:hypothetical protein
MIGWNGAYYIAIALFYESKDIHFIFYKNRNYVTQMKNDIAVHVRLQLLNVFLMRCKINNSSMIEMHNNESTYHIECRQ